MKSIGHAQRQDAMDHSEAVRMRAAEKYVLGELSPVLREEYEGLSRTYKGFSGAFRSV